MCLELKDLVGTYVLSGVDYGSIKKKVRWSDDEYEDASAIRFQLDDTVYEAVEDPNDGYRSAMDEIRTSELPLDNTFYPHPVTVRYVDDRLAGSSRIECDIIEIVDNFTGVRYRSRGKS